MRRAGILVAVIMSSANLLPAQETNTLIAESDPAIQAQIKRTYNAFLAAGENVKTNCAAFDEVQRLKEFKSEAVKQLAIFVATTDSEEDSHVLLTGMMLNMINPPPSVPIRVLAPYVDADNKKLRDFARIWFFDHDGHGRIHSRSPLASVNYYDYMQYVRSQYNMGEEVPTPFIKYLYEERPDKAFLVFALADRQANAMARMGAIHDALQANREGREKTPEEVREQRQWLRQDQISRQRTKQEQSEMLLAEHIVSNAIWLKENGFAERFQKASPEAEAELAKLAENDAWWARLYVAEIMRQHRELRQDDVVKRLSQDREPLVAKAAKAAN